VGRFDGRTEEPTPRVRRKARREGRVARSPEVGVAVSLVGAVLAARVLFPSAARSLALGTRELLWIAPQEPPPQPVLRAVTGMLLGGIAPFLALAFVLGMAGGLAQTGFLLAPGALAPKLSRLSPRQGLQRLRPSAMGWEAARAVGKLGLLLALAWGPIRGAVEDAASARSLAAWVELVAHRGFTILVRVAALATVVAVADYLVTRMRTKRSLRMTRRELLQEHKEMEGDPLVRMRRRRRHRELSRNRMIADVATADVVITNPIHLAVALRYLPGEPAPRVVAKGAGRLAQRIRSVAARHGILVREDAPLARAIYRRCRVGQFIPPALYEAVAIVLAIAYRRRRLGVM
jgi:flagellar biosynthetic protein FlhB